MPDYSSLKFLLERITSADLGEGLDPQPDYATRNRLVYMALGRAAAQGIPCGIRQDPSEPTWPVVYLELPTGQVSWHLPQHDRVWDGHSTPEKYRRIQDYVNANA